MTSQSPATRPTRESAASARKQIARAVVETVEARTLMSVASFTQPQAVAIPDISTVRSTLNVGGMTGTLTDVNVRVNATHTWDADLDVFLVGPNGTRVELFTDVGGSGDNFANTTLDDQAGTGIATAAAPFAGTFRPEGSLAAFNGQNANGTWTLEVTDDEGGDIGTLANWSLAVTTNTAPPANQQPLQMSTGFYYPVPFAVSGDPSWLDGAPGRPAYLPGKVHFGSDLLTAQGTPVFAVARGTVLDRRPDGFGNEVIFVQHQSTAGPFVAVYAHIRGSVSAGMTVDPGTVIGQVADYQVDGNGGNDHLHFGIRPGTSIPPSDGVTYGWGRADLSWYQLNGRNGFEAPISYLRSYTPASTTSNASPAAPTNFRFAPTGVGQGVLAWSDNSNNESGFRLQWLNGSTWTTWYTTTANVTSVSVSMATGHLYQMRVVSFNQYGEQVSGSIGVLA